MRLWISHIRNLEGFAEDHQRLLDAWQEAGVDGVVIGPMQLNQAETLAHSRQREMLPHQGHARSAFAPDPQIYASLGVEPPAGAEAMPAPGDGALLRQVSVALNAVVDRGLELWIFDPTIGANAPDAGDTGARLCDGGARVGLAARMLDTVAAFPMATGVIIDGPAWGFEITEIPETKLARRRLIFDELPAHNHDAIRKFGHDPTTMIAARQQLEASLHNLDDHEVGNIVSGGAGAAEIWRWLGGPGMIEWLDFRSASLTAFYEYLTDTLHTATDRPVSFAVCPRQPSFATLAGYDYQAIAELVDVIMPKFYYWQRGYDGTAGTAFRWAQTLTHWNPGLSVRAATRLTRALFGSQLPDADDLIDFDLLVTPEYVGSLASADARFSLEATGDAARVVPWVDTGRAPHDGDPLTAAHLDAILSAASAQGVERVNFFNSTNLTEADWTILSHHCGKRWNPLTSDFLPADRPTL